MLLSLLMISLLVLSCAPKQPGTMEDETSDAEQGSPGAAAKAVSDAEVEAELEKLSLGDLDDLIKAGEAAKGKPLSEQAYNNEDWLTLAYKVKADKLAEQGSTGTESAEKLNHAPVFKDFSNKDGAENEEITFKVTATDEDGDVLTYEVKDDPPGADLSKTGKFSWTPGFDKAGEYEMTFIVSDGKTTATKTITLSVANTNRPPKFTEEWELTTKLELVVGETETVFLGATDEDGDTLQYGMDSKDLAGDIDVSTGQVFLAASDMEPLGYTVTFTVTDGMDTVEKTLNVLAFPETCAKNIACPASYFCGEFTSKCEPWDLTNIKNPLCQSGMNNSATQASCVSKAIDYWTNDMAGHNLCYKVDPALTLNSCTITKPTDKYKYDCSFTVTCDYSSLV